MSPDLEKTFINVVRSIEERVTIVEKAISEISKTLIAYIKSVEKRCDCVCHRVLMKFKYKELDLPCCECDEDLRGKKCT